jgi:hypothetical protein
VSRAAPPEKKTLGRGQANPEQKSIKLRRRYRPYRFPASGYWRLLAHRYARNLLTPFHCSCCGRQSLDPIGWNGYRQPLCESCADRGVSK